MRSIYLQKYIGAYYIIAKKNMFLDQSKRVYKKKVTAKGKENKYLVKKLDTSNNMLSTDNDQIRENTSMSNNNIDDNYECK